MRELTSRRLLRRQLARILLAPLLLLLFALAILVWQVRNLEEAFEWVHRADGSIGQARWVLRTAVEQESNFRAYLLTQDAQFLQNYEEGERKFKERTDGLCASLQQIPEQQQNCRKLYTDYSDFDSIAQATFDQIRSGSKTIRYADVVLRGKKEMDELRLTQENLVRTEDDVRSAKVAESQRVAKRLDFTVVVLATLFAIALLLETLRNIRSVDREYGAALSNLRSRATELRDSRERLDVTLRSIADGVIVTDNDDTVRFMNAAAESVTGCDRVASNGKPIAEIYQPSISKSDHLQLTRSDGAIALIEQAAAPIRSANGLIIGKVVVLRDVTERQSALELLRQSERLAVAGRLSASIAHEIHNPLDTVGNLLYLLERSNDEELRNGLLQSAKRELARVIQITKGMLGLYRQSRTPVEVSVEDCVHGVLLLASARIRDKNLELVTDIRSERKVMGFPSELRQILANLIANAVDASPDAGRITVGAEDAALADGAPAVAISIADSGSGIPPELQATLFRPFFTTKGQEGTGLGLWITHELIQKHGGSISFESGASGESGTTFTVTLPSSATAPASPEPPLRQTVSV